MKIPQRLQIFESEVVISTKDEERLGIHLSNWCRLHEMFLLGVNAPDLRRLVIMELAGANRKQILNRLLGRLAKVERRELLRRMEAASA